MLSSRKKENSYNYCWICDWLLNVTIDWRLWLVMGEGCCSCWCLLIVWSCYCCGCCCCYIRYLNRNCNSNAVEFFPLFVCFCMCEWMCVCIWYQNHQVIWFYFGICVRSIGCCFYLSCENVYLRSKNFRISLGQM